MIERTLCPPRRATAALIFRVGLAAAVALSLAAVSVSPVAAAGASDDQSVPDQLRVLGPKTLSPGRVQLIYAEGKAAGDKDWRGLHPDVFTVDVSDPAKLVPDPAGVAMNPVAVQLPEDAAAGTVTVSIRAGGKSASQDFKVSAAKPAGEFVGSVDAKAAKGASHRFAGLGAGVLFYDNQFEISATGDIYDWCFKDVRASFLHVLIRPDYEPQNDNDDPGTLDGSKFDFKATERPLRIAGEALKRNKDLKVFASLYTPPAWMKANDSTVGNAGLKPGGQYRREVAEYVLAYLKHARGEGVAVHSLGFFNEPDFPHGQDGMHVPDLVELAELFRDVTAALDALMKSDPDFKDPKLRPLYVFPDTLGPGSVTRAGDASKKLRAKSAMLKPVGVWGVHDYWFQSGDYWEKRYRELRAFPGVGNKPVWMTEWAQRFRRGDLASGVEYGRNMLNALRLGAQAWMAFEWCHPAGNQAGLISTDWGEGGKGRRYWRSKAYHVFRQVANTTPADGQVLTVRGKWNGQSQGNGRGVEYLVVKGKAKDGERVVIHLLNSEPAATKFRVSVGGAATKVTESFLTGPGADMAAGPKDNTPVTRQGSTVTISGTVPEYSLLTIVLR